MVGHLSRVGTVRDLEYFPEAHHSHIMTTDYIKQKFVLQNFESWQSFGLKTVKKMQNC